MSFQIGDTVGPYQITGIVGSGGMARIFKIEHTITRRTEAMKVLLSGQHDPELHQRFLREIQVHAGLTHPNIVSVHNALSAGDNLVMVMELVEGQSLDRLLERGRIPWARGIDYICQALSALSYAHACGVTHRDVKPENMIITADGSLKLTDFGLARGTADLRRLTQSGVMMGSAYYVSPEQARGLSTVDARSDIYSVGAVLYEVVAGRKPFEGEGTFAILRAHVEENPVPPVEIDSSVGPALNGAILKALAKKPEDRFASAGEFRAALESCQTAPGPRITRARAARIGAFLAILALVLVAVGSWWRAIQPLGNSAQPAGPRTIRVRSKVTLSTGTHKTGDSFTATLEESLVVNNRVIAPKGAIVEGEIVEADKGGRIRGRAGLSVRLTRLRGANGRSVRLTTNSIHLLGRERSVVPFRRGAAVTLPADTLLTFEFLGAQPTG